MKFEAGSDGLGLLWPSGSGSAAIFLGWCTGAYVAVATKDPVEGDDLVHITAIKSQSEPPSGVHYAYPYARYKEARDAMLIALAQPGSSFLYPLMWTVAITNVTLGKHNPSKPEVRYAVAAYDREGRVYHRLKHSSPAMLMFDAPFFFEEYVESASGWTRPAAALSPGMSSSAYSLIKCNPSHTVVNASLVRAPVSLDAMVPDWKERMAKYEKKVIKKFLGGS